MDKFITFSDGTDTFRLNASDVSSIETNADGSNTLTNVYMKNSGTIVDTAGTGYVNTNVYTIVHADDSAAAETVAETLYNAIETALTQAWHKPAVAAEAFDVAITSVTRTQVTA